MVRSSTAIDRTVSGSAASSASTGNGRNRRTVSDADPLAVGDQLLDRFADGTRPGSHQHDDPFGVGGAVVVDEAVPAAGDVGEPIEDVGDGLGNGVVERVRRLAGLEEHVGVLRGAADHRGGRPEPPQLVGDDVVFVDERPQRVVVEQLDAVDLVRGAEPVEEVEERDPGAQGRGVRHGGEVVRLLHRARAEHGESGRAGGHDVAVVAEDRQGVGGERPRRHVDHRRRQLAGDLEHVRQHQQQPLGRGERGRERAGLQRTVQRARRTALGLHLDDVGHRPPQVRLPGGRPRIGVLAHRGRGRDRIDRHDLGECVGDTCGRLVAVKAV